MKYLCNVFCENEHDSVSAAVVETNDLLHSFVLSVLQALGALISRTDFLRVEFLHYNVDFYEKVPDDLLPLVEQLDGETILPLPEDTSLSGEIRLAYSTLLIEDDCIRWTGRGKYCGSSMETAGLTYEELGWEDCAAISERHKEKTA